MSIKIDAPFANCLTAARGKFEEENLGPQGALFHSHGRVRRLLLTIGRRVTPYTHVSCVLRVSV